MNTKILTIALLSMLLPRPMAANEHAAWLAKIEGLYMGHNNPTPFGKIGFAMDMMKQADASVRGRLYSDRDTYFDFAFCLNDKGVVTFHETGSLGQAFVQSHELELMRTEGDTLTFATPREPMMLIAEVTADGNRLRVKVLLRGKAHVDLDMRRVRDELVIAKFRTDQARAKELPGGSAMQQFFAAAASKTVDGNLSKREQARLHLQAMRKLAEQAEKADRSERPILTLMMKGHLDRAIELDPLFDQAHFALATWYLQSPEPAAKTQDKVQELLATLERMHSPLAEVLRKKLAGGE